jgi:signal transduction histidine kinase
MAPQHPASEEFSYEGAPPQDATPAVEVAVLRVAQEALHNALRHADSRLIRVRLSHIGPRLVLEINDNGKGFDLAPDSSRGLGLASMRDRAENAGGSLEVATAPAGGTTVRLEVPA